MEPSETDQLSPHAGHDIAGMALKDAPALFKRLSIPLMRGEQENQVVGQLANPGVASDEPSKFRFFICDSGFIGGIGPGGGVVVDIHVRWFRFSAAGTRLAVTGYCLDSARIRGVCSADRRRAGVGDDRTAHKGYQEALRPFLRIRLLKPLLPFFYRLDRSAGPESGPARPVGGPLLVLGSGGIHSAQYTR